MRDIARKPMPFRHRQRFHQLPAGEVGNAHIAELSGAHEIVECRQHLLDRRSRIEGVQLQEIDIVRAEPAQRVLDTLDQSRARRARIVRPLAHRQAGLGRDDHLIAPALDRRTQHLLRSAVRINIGGIEQIDPGFQADIDEPPCLIDVRIAPGAEKRSLPAERPRTEAQGGNPEAGCTQMSVFHDCFSLVMLIGTNFQALPAVAQASAGLWSRRMLRSATAKPASVISAATSGIAPRPGP